MLYRYPGIHEFIPKFGAPTMSAACVLWEGQQRTAFMGSGRVLLQIIA